MIAARQRLLLTAWGTRWTAESMDSRLASRLRDLAAAGSGPPRCRVACYPYRGDDSSVVVQRTVDRQRGFAFAHDPGRLGDLVDIAAHTGGAGAEADHRH